MPQIQCSSCLDYVNRKLTFSSVRIMKILQPWVMQARYTYILQIQGCLCQRGLYQIGMSSKFKAFEHQKSALCKLRNACGLSNTTNPSIYILQIYFIPRSSTVPCKSTTVPALQTFRLEFSGPLFHPELIRLSDQKSQQTYFDPPRSSTTNYLE